MADFIPGINSHNHAEGQYIENQDTPEHFIDGFLNGGFRIMGFPGGDADDFNAQVGVHHHDQSHEGAADAVGEEATVGPQVRNPHRLPAVADAEEDHAGTADNHEDNGADLNQGKPEFKLPVSRNGNEINHRHQEEGTEGRYPLGQVGIPEIHVNPYGRQFRHTSNHPHIPVGPAGEIAPLGSQETGGMGTEGAGYRVGHGQFAQGPHNEINRNAADDISQKHRRPCQFDGCGGSEEQAYADGSAKTDQLDVPVLQPSFKVLMHFLIIFCHMKLPNLTKTPDPRPFMGKIRRKELLFLFYTQTPCTSRQKFTFSILFRTYDPDLMTQGGINFMHS